MLYLDLLDKPSFSETGISWCRIEDIEGKYLHGSKSGQFLSKITIDQMNLKVIPKGSVLFTCSASVGIVTINTNELCTNQTFIGLVPSQKIDKDYLYYMLKVHKNNFMNLASVTTIPYISKRQFEEYELNIVGRSQQSHIAKVLSDIDSKIEINNQIILNLDEMSKTLYNYWFVQFDFFDEKN